MRAFVHMSDPEQHAALAQAISRWAAVNCILLDVSPWAPDAEEDAPAILFWDLDVGTLPPSRPTIRALFLCSSDPRAAISSYAIHPTGFFQTPIRTGDLYAALNSCRGLWWDQLERLEILCGRLRLRLPLCDLVWAEGARRGCLIHSTRECLPDREPLSALEQRLAPGLFLRCQRSFLVNLNHIRGLDSEGLLMSDGAQIPLSRANRKAAADAYQKFLQWRDGVSPTPLKKDGAR